MNSNQEPLETLKEIREIMDRSSRFISLSGLSGIVAGLIALVGAGVVKWHLSEHHIVFRDEYSSKINWPTAYFLSFVAGLVLLLAIVSGIYFTNRQAKKRGDSIFDKQAKRLLFNLAIPLAVGGLFCAILLWHGIIFLIAPAMLIFYGLALINGSKYTLTDVRYLGFSEIILGLFSAFYIGNGLLSWAIGFGVLHIIYGSLMYFKYERS